MKKKIKKKKKKAEIKVLKKQIIVNQNLKLIKLN